MSSYIFEIPVVYPAEVVKQKCHISSIVGLKTIIPIQIKSVAKEDIVLSILWQNSDKTKVVKYYSHEGKLYVSWKPTMLFSEALAQGHHPFDLHEEEMAQMKMVREIFNEGTQFREEYWTAKFQAVNAVQEMAQNAILVDGKIFLLTRGPHYEVEYSSGKDESSWTVKAVFPKKNESHYSPFSYRGDKLDEALRYIERANQNLKESGGDKAEDFLPPKFINSIKILSPSPYWFDDDTFLLYNAVEDFVDSTKKKIGDWKSSDIKMWMNLRDSLIWSSSSDVSDALVATAKLINETDRKLLPRDIDEEVLEALKLAVWRYEESHPDTPETDDVDFYAGLIEGLDNLLESR